MRPLRDLRLQAGLRRALGRGRPPLARRRHPPHADRQARGRRHRDARRARARARASRRRGFPPDTFAKIREQAELQLWAREHGEDKYALLQPQAGAGFALLPEPSPGDLFFDFEGNPFWDKDGSLEYLWGILDVDRNFTPLHAHDHASERAAFEQFVDLVHARLRAYPDLHVYHYASVRDHRAAAADGPLRHARGRARRPAAPRRLRRPAQGRAQRPPRLAARATG